MATKTAKTAKTDKTDDTMTDRMSEGARDFVKRSTSTVQERTDDLYQSSKKYNADLESMLVRAAKGYTDILSNMADVAYANMNHTLATTQKLAEAKSLQEAFQIQSDFMRERTSTNMENLRSAFDYVRDVASENAENMRETAAQAMKTEKDAAKAA